MLLASVSLISVWVGELHCCLNVISWAAAHSSPYLFFSTSAHRILKTDLLDLYICLFVCLLFIVYDILNWSLNFPLQMWLKYNQLVWGYFLVFLTMWDVSYFVINTSQKEFPLSYHVTNNILFTKELSAWRTFKKNDSTVLHHFLIFCCCCFCLI